MRVLPEHRAPHVAAIAPLEPFARSMEATFAHSARMVASGIDEHLPDADTLLACLPPGALLGSAHSYTRHLVYADPLERFSAMLLVWRPGQSSPVHGHRTWCAYRVLQGTLSERHYRWSPETRRARQTGQVARTAGDTFSVPAGLQHIHALGNASDAIAVSLHIYGVEPASIATGVNLLVDAELA